MTWPAALTMAMEVEMASRLRVDLRPLLMDITLPDREGRSLPIVPSSPTAGLPAVEELNRCGRWMSRSWRFTC